MIYYILIIVGILTRFLPHPANFTAVGATALFAGYYFKNKKAAIAIPFLIMLISDWKIGFYSLPIMFSVYLSFAVVVMLGILISKRKWLWALPTSILATVIFFLTTNFAVWQFGTWYPHTLTGLMTCYAMGLPFVKNQFAGDLIYTFGFFGSFELVKYFVSNKKTRFAKVLVG